ncbi:MAG TPA: HAMP domain-containing sensor histidine kinase [Nitrososphaeraceae archaeon]|nr:HAMP domain-containing sensor histidine kinase [Nitrososphaeraceae archaeon]
MNKSEILYGVENAVGRGVYFMSNVKQKMDIFFDHHAPSIVVEVREYRDGYIDIRKRGGKIRTFTEITKDNVKHCKELIKIVDELRHLDGVKGGIAINDSEYMATTVLQEAKPLTQVIYSNVKEVVEQGQYIFDTLWNVAIPAEQKIREIEEGKIIYETRIIENNPDEIVRQISRLAADSTELATCLTPGGMQYSYNYFFNIKKNLMDKQKRGEHKGIRYVTTIDKDNLGVVKTYLESGIQVRHVRNLPPMSFGVSDKEIAATIEKMEGGNRVQSLLISNEPLYQRHFASIFEELWGNGIDAADMIKDIEEGVDFADIEVIPNPRAGIAKAQSIISAARKEVSILVSSANALRRQVQMGGLQLLKNVSEQQGAKVRLLVPDENENDGQRLSTILEEVKIQCPQVNVRTMEKGLHTRITIVLADRKECTIIELKDDTKDISYSAAGLSTYSNSKSTVSSYVSIFETFWKQTELYEKLKVHDKMQKEFINVAAHELRTPVQPILGLSEVLLSKKGNIEDYIDLVSAINRNAKRLQHLTEDILDVTRIESHTLILHKEEVDVCEKILNVIDDTKDQINDPGKLRVVFYQPKNPVYVSADKTRLYQVIANLLNNAIKFTKEGTISINVEDKENSQVTISVKDTGAGISPEIAPRLFTKFVTTSDAGTGLGLYLSKSIVDAHGGKMWAQNNPGKVGATFGFTFPKIQ